jgi:hypothetical protein
VSLSRYSGIRFLHLSLDCTASTEHTVCEEMRARSNQVDNAANGFAIRENMEDVKGKGGSC